MTAPTPIRAPASRLTLIASWSLVVAWAGLIFYFSSIPHLRITQQWYDIILRKIAHMFVFGVLAFLIYRSLERSRSGSRDSLWRWAFIMAFLYACSDEYHQSFVVGRHGAPLDVVIDSVGIWLGLRSKTS